MQVYCTRKLQGSWQVRRVVDAASTVKTISINMASVDDQSPQHSMMAEHSQARKRRRTEDINGQTTVRI